MKWMRASRCVVCPCFGREMSEIPFDRLGIPEAHRKPLLPGAPLKLRQAAAAGKLPLPPEVAMAVAFVLLSDEDSGVRESAGNYLADLPEEALLKMVGRETHPKILEFLVEHHLEDERFATRVVNLRHANPRTVQLMAKNCGPGVLEAIALNQERLILEPELYGVLQSNERANRELLKRVETFLRMQGMLEKEAEPAATPQAKPKKESAGKRGSSAPVEKKRLSAEELEAEIAAAIAGTQAPTAAGSSSLPMFDLGDDEEEKDTRPSKQEEVGDFEFSFDEETVEFSWSLVSDDKKSGEDEDEEEEVLSMEQQVANMSVGQRIKLAYTGNQSTRKLLLRDSNKLVSSAVVKSGRMTDAEILATAGNRNIPTEILNYIARDKEQLRKYPIRVALASNPKTPVPVALRLLRDLSKADLRSLSMNRNVSGVVFETAGRMYKQKFQK